MRAFSRSHRFASLHIGGRPAEGSEFEQVGGGSSGLPAATVRDPLVGHLPLPGKGKERIREIRYPTSQCRAFQCDSESPTSRGVLESV